MPVVCFGGAALSLHSLLMQILLGADLCLYFLAGVGSGIQWNKCRVQKSFSPSELWLLWQSGCV